MLSIFSQAYCHWYLFLVRCLLRLSLIFLMGLFVFLLLSFKNILHILDNFFIRYLLQTFSPSLWLVFSFFWHCLSQSRSFVVFFFFSEVQFFLIHWLVFGEQNLPNLKLPTFSLMSSFKSFRVLHFTVRSRMHFELILVKGIRSVSRFLVFCI